MNKIVSITGQKATNAEQVEKILRSALDSKPTEVVVIGVDEHGVMSLGSTMTAADILWMLESAKMALFTGATG